MIKKTLLICAGLAASLALMTGCEWTAGGGSDDGQTWNERAVTGDQGQTVDFSGSYKALSGNVVVRQFGSGASGSTTNTTSSTNTVAGEVLAVGDGTTTAFSGALAHGKPVPRSLTIVVGGYRFSDSGTLLAGTAALTVTPADGSAGTINLDTGVWVLSFPSPIANGTQILGAYQYLSTTNTVTSAQGNHGNPIYSFILYQMGNKVQLVDNNNSKYDGQIGNIAFLGTDRSQASVSLDARGFSQGYNVQIVGTLKRTTVISSFISGYSNNVPIYSTQSSGGFRMLATFIEEGGYSGDIDAAGPSF